MNQSLAIRIPQQQRSKRRVLAILKASTALIARHGILGLKMNDVARSAGIPIGSVYQYFPTKSALIAHLFSQHLDVYHRLGERYLSEARTPEQSAAKLRRLVVVVYLDNRRNTLMREVWAGVQADRTIREIHLRDNAFFSDLLYKFVRAARSTVPEAQLRRRCQVVNEMWDGTIRLAITLDQKQGDALLQESIRLGLSNLGLESQ
ncbi:MAG: TetR/AcrR family transcriptional regulator [Steroidobacteraceae bacterium]